MKRKDVLFVLGLKKNILSISALDAKGMRVAFVYVQVLMLPKGNTFDDGVVIREQEGGLYKLKGHPEQALVHDIVEPNELWHMCITEHYHLQAKLLKVFQKCKQSMKAFSKDVQKEITQRRHFQVARARKKESWKSFTPMYAVQCDQVH